MDDIVLVSGGYVLQQWDLLDDVTTLSPIPKNTYPSVQ